MPPLLDKLFGKIEMAFSFLNRTNSPSYKQVQKTESGVNVGRDININIPGPDVTTQSRVILVWGARHFTEDSDRVVYTFDAVLQNKSDHIINDGWINFESSGLVLELERTTLTHLFQGTNNWNSSLSLMTEPGYRWAPQAFLTPFRVRVILEKSSLPLSARLYFSWGAKGAAKSEVTGQATREDLEALLKSEDRDTAAFLQTFGLSRTQSKEDVIHI